MEKKFCDNDLMVRVKQWIAADVNNRYRTKDVYQHPPRTIMVVAYSLPCGPTFEVEAESTLNRTDRWDSQEGRNIALERALRAVATQVLGHLCSLHNPEDLLFYLGELAGNETGGRK